MRLLTLCLILLTTLLGRPASADPAAGNILRIGMSAPFSGPNGAYGLDMRRTIEAYFQQVNQQGGIHGKSLELLAVDDGYETERTLSNTRSLIEDKQVFALLGYYGSSPTQDAMNKGFGPAHVPLVGTISGAEALREPPSRNPNTRYMFNVRASYADETAVIVDQLAALGLKRIAVFYQNDGFGQAGLEGVNQALKKHDLTPIAVATVERNSLDVGKAVSDIAKAQPQAVIMVTLYKPTAAFVKGMQQSGQRPMFMTLSPVGAAWLSQELGNAARGIGISQVVPYPWNDTLPLVRDYQQLIGKGATPSYYGLEGYLMARVLVEGLRRAGKAPTREKLVSALEGLQHADFGGYRISYGPDNRNGSRFVELTVIGAGGRVMK